MVLFCVGSEIVRVCCAVGPTDGPEKEKTKKKK